MKLTTAVTLTCTIVVFSSCFIILDSADQTEATQMNSQVEFVSWDENGHMLSKTTMSVNNVVLDTTTRASEVQYILKCDSVANRLPSSLKIYSDSGFFGLNVCIQGLQDTQYALSGVQMVVGGTFTADLRYSNSYSSTLVNSEGESCLESNHTYSVQLFTLDGSHSLITPDMVSGAVATFTMYASENTRIILFVDEKEDYGTVVSSVGSEIVLPPSPTNIKEFHYWVDPDGNAYVEKSTMVVSSDTILYAAWGETNYVTIIIYVLLFLVILIIAFAAYEYRTYPTKLSGTP